MSYDFALDLTSINSNSSIIRRLKPLTHVLELGCAHGRMTKYLKEKLHCTVDIVEIDQVAGKEASKYAKINFIGKYGDIESLFWYRKLKNVRYDYIIFADVLEHLKDPQKILAASKDLLKPTGKILLSIPNISHNSVIIDLLLDRFVYVDAGLLDKTHIKFFTEESLVEMINMCDLEVSDSEKLKNPVGNTEFETNYEDIPEEVANYLKQRDNADTYQFVVELKIKDEEIKIMKEEEDRKKEEEKKRLEEKQIEDEKNRILNARQKAEEELKRALEQIELQKEALKKLEEDQLELNKKLGIEESVEIIADVVEEIVQEKPVIIEEEPVKPVKKTRKSKKSAK